MSRTVDYLNPGQWPVYIGFTTDEGAFQREMKRLKVADPPPFIACGANATTHILENHGTLCFVIAMTPPSRRVSKEQYASLVAHEALHVVQEMERVLYRTGRFDDENAAYLLQYIVQFCLEKAWATGRSRRIKPVQ